MTSFPKFILHPCIPCHPWLKIFLLFWLPPLAAQTEEKSWSIRVAALDIAGEHASLWLSAGPGKEPVEVPLNTRVFSDVIEHKGAAGLAFHASADDASAEEPPPPLATAVLKSRSSLLVLAPDAEGKSYRAFAIDDREFPFGSFRLVNLSKAAIRAEFAGKVVALKPGGAETIAFRAAEQDIPVRIHSMMNDQAPRLIRQSSWSITPTQRELILFLPNDQNDLIRLRHFVDTREEPPKGE
jgi:hypothetical protein